MVQPTRDFEKLLSNVQMTNVPLGPGGLRLLRAAALLSSVLFCAFLGLEVFACQLISSAIASAFFFTVG